MTASSVQRATKFCPNCGALIDATTATCPTCGTRQPALYGGGMSEKRLLPATILAGLFGYLGVHRFYVGKIGTGILMLLTAGGLGIWWFIDFVMIVVGAFRDADGNRITEWT
ncbi:MAG TPA: TM2 domain-containing protein [Gemmatimonadaceae bacterium]